MIYVEQRSDGRVIDHISSIFYYFFLYIYVRHSWIIFARLELTIVLLTSQSHKIRTRVYLMSIVVKKCLW
jgi:hypothetical protein